MNKMNDRMNEMNEWTQSNELVNEWMNEKCTRCP